jgi:hypothetical protein
VEKYLYDLNANLAKASSSTNSHHHAVVSPNNTNTNIVALGSSFSGSPHNEGSVRRPSIPVQTPLSETTRGGYSFDNAVLDSMHTSTTESILQWPHFDTFPSLRTDHASIFHLEQSRSPLKMRPNAMYPYVGIEDIDSILDSFQHNVNFWYPTMSQSQISRIRSTLESGVPSDDTIEACLTLLTLALGCASQIIAGLRHGGAMLSEDETRKRLLRRNMGDIYFESALKKMHVAHLHVTSEAIQCLFFAA